MTISYWQEQVGLPGLDRPPSEAIEIETDLCIVGAGIIGAGTAYWAAQQGLRGVVVEAREAALGASGRNAGFVLSGIAGSYFAAVQKYGREAAHSLWALSIENRTLMLELAQRLDIPTLPCGSLLLAESEEEGAELARSVALLKEDGFPGTFSPTDPLNRHFVAGLFRDGDGVLQPAALTRAILHSTGFGLVAGSPVTHFEETAEGVVIHSERATIRARWLILATNAWSAQVHPYFAGKVVPMRGQIYVTEPAPLIFDTAGYSHYGFWYFRQIPEPTMPGYGRWLVGGARHLHFASENNNPSEAIHAPVQDDLEAWTRHHFPEFAEVPVSHRWAGMMGFTADGLPLVGRLPGQQRVAFSVGFNGHGMGLGIMVARRAVDLLLHDASPGLFDAERATIREGQWAS